MSAFESLGLHQALCTAVARLGFTEPTPIQKLTIPVLTSGTRDVVALAQTGTGKTAAFGLPAVQMCMENPFELQVLVLSPTRELCLQITADLKLFTSELPDVRVCAVYGGSSIQAQIKELRDRPAIIVATPGRLIDLIDRKAARLDTVRYIVLDEADEMLNMGFRDDIDYILQNTPARQSTWLFSATMPDAVRQISGNYMTNPEEISAGSRNVSAANITHRFYVVQQRDRFEALKRLVDYHPGMYAIIFCRTRAETQEIAERLIREGYDIEALHGDLTQQQRDRVMGRFRDRSLQLLIATDVAARGIDVSDLTHVINYSLPDEPEVYTHRSGRTGRAGKSGECLSLVTPREQTRIRHIARLLSSTPERGNIPNGPEITRKQFSHFLEKIATAPVGDHDYQEFLDPLFARLSEVSKEDLLERIVALEFERFMKYYKDAIDLNPSTPDQGRKGTPTSGGERGEAGGPMSRLFINLGTRDGFYKASMLQFLLDHSGLKKADLGRIDLGDTRTIVEVDEAHMSAIIETFDGGAFRGRRIRVEKTGEHSGRRPQHHSSRSESPRKGGWKR